MSFKLGLNGVLSFRATGHKGAGDWLEAKIVKDVTFDPSNGESDMTTRESGGWRAFVPTLSEGTLEFEMLWRPGDPAFDALQTAFQDKAAIGVQIEDEEDGDGWSLDMAVFGFSVAQPLAEGQTVNVRMRNTVSTDPPEWLGAEPPGDP